MTSRSRSRSRSNDDDEDDVYSEASHYSSSSEELSVGSTTTSPSKGSHVEPSSHHRLDPQSVLDLARSLPNCRLVTPPPPPTTATATDGDGRRGPSAEASTAASFSNLGLRFRRTFFDGAAADDDDDESGEPTGTGEPEERILSFLASDPETASAGGPDIARVDVYCRTGTVCTCRVVPVLPAATTTTAFSAAPSVPPSVGSPAAASLFSSLLATPRMANVKAGAGDLAEWTTLLVSSGSAASGASSATATAPTPTPAPAPAPAPVSTAVDDTNQDHNHNHNHNHNHISNHKHKHNRTTCQVRRVFRRNCSLAALRRILERPPRLADIPASIVSDAPFDPSHRDDGSAHSRSSSAAASSLASTASEAVKRRRRRRWRRQHPRERERETREKEAVLPPPKKSCSDLFSPQQRQFLDVQRRNYRRRLRREERARARIAREILAGNHGEGDGVLPGSFEDDDDDDGSKASTASEGFKASRSDSGVVAAEIAMEASEGQSDGYLEQRRIRRQIDLADVGLAILMGEAEVLEKMTKAMQKNEDDDEEEDEDGDGMEKTENVANPTKKDDARGNSKGEGGKRHGEEEDEEESVSTLDQSVENYDDDDDNDKDSFYEESEAEEIAKWLQGCQIEYSFPFEHHLDLEDALLARRRSDGDEDDDDVSYDASYDDYHSETEESQTSVTKPPKRRGRSLSSMRDCTNKSNRPNETLQRNRHQPDPPPSVVAIPTNGEGCIVLRDTGGFSVIGEIPRKLSELLFRRRGPLPSYIALGTKQRYYVRFEDGSTSFHGPTSLDAFLKEPRRCLDAGRIKGGTKRANQRKRHHHPRFGTGRDTEIVSVAFGKEFGDYFIVRANGSWEANGELPSGLEKLLDSRRDRGDLRWVALGPEGEWCVKARNGRVWWGGVSREIDEILVDILIDGQEELTYLDCGVDGSYFMIYQ
ncbi:hypothetical protein ACHAXS_013206 [Conticribra weissflogii]